MPLDTLCGLYDPDRRALGVCLVGSLFVLALFLATPNFTRLSSLFGVGTTVAVVTIAAAMLARETYLHGG